MSGSRWVTAPSWLSRSLRPFLYSSMYSYHLFLISSASVRSLLFLSFIICPSLHEMFPWCLEFSWRDLWSFPFFCFLLFLCIVHLRRLCSLSLLFSGTLHSFICIFPFPLCLLLPSDTFCLCLDLHTLSTIYFIFFQCKHPEQSFCLVASIQSIDICMRSMKRGTYIYIYIYIYIYCLLPQKKSDYWVIHICAGPC